MKALICMACGGPLPRPDAGSDHVTCAYCGTSSDLRTGSLGSQPSNDQLTAVAVKERFAAELTALQQGYQQAVAAGMAPKAAFWQAASTAFAALADPTAMTHVVFGIAEEFDRQHKTGVAADANAIPRLAVAYLDSLQQLAQHDQHEINIPFLAATAEGPVHFRQPVTKQWLQQLAAGP